MCSSTALKGVGSMHIWTVLIVRKGRGHKSIYSSERREIIVNCEMSISSRTERVTHAVLMTVRNVSSFCERSQDDDDDDDTAPG